MVSCVDRQMIVCIDPFVGRPVGARGMCVIVFDVARLGGKTTGEAEVVSENLIMMLPA